MTDDFNYEAPNVDHQEDVQARVERDLYTDEEITDHVVEAGGHRIPVQIRTRKMTSYVYRKADGREGDQLDGCFDDGPASVETDEVKWVAWCARTTDDVTIPHPGYKPDWYHATRYDRDMDRDDEKVGTRADAIQDILDQIALDLTDPCPVDLRAHLDQELIKEINEDGAELAKKGLRQAILAVDFGNNDLKAVVISERKPYAADKYDNGAVEAVLYEITAPGHRYRRCEKFAAGTGSRPHGAVMSLLAHYAEEMARHHPSGVDAMSVGADLDLLCAQARRRWKQGIEDHFYVEAYVLDARGQLPECLTTHEYDRLGYRPEMGQRVCVVRERWFTAPKLFRPSSDWNDAMALFEDLAHTMWGSADISLDGDCFNPPPWRMSHSGGFADLHHGVAVGDTGQLAICRAFLHTNGERPKVLRWDLNDDNVYDPFGDAAREKLQRERDWAEDEAAPAADLTTDAQADDNMRRGDPNGDLT